MVSLPEHIALAKIFHVSTNSPVVQVQCKASWFVYAACDSVPVLPV